jgi:triosephosphate isomerase
MKKTLIVGNWKMNLNAGNETNLRFFSSRGALAKPKSPAVLFPNLRDGYHS